MPLLLKNFVRPDKHKKHMDSCSGVPGIVYNYNNKSLVTFEDNFDAKGDLPMAIYFDYETTVPLTNNYFDPDHPHLIIRKIAVERTYVYSINQLTTIDYLSEDQMKYIVIKLVKQLNNIAQEVGKKKKKKKSKNGLGQMFSDTAIVKKKPLIQWFHAKIKSQNLEIDLRIKNQFERENAINWETNVLDASACLKLSHSNLTYQSFNVSW